MGYMSIMGDLQLPDTPFSFDAPIAVPTAPVVATVPIAHAPTAEFINTSNWFDGSAARRYSPREIAVRTSVTIILRAVSANSKRGLASVRVRVDRSIADDVAERLKTKVNGLRTISTHAIEQTASDYEPMSDPLKYYMCLFW